MSIIISPEASQDLDEISSYLSNFSLDAATRFVDAVAQKCETLAKVWFQRGVSAVSPPSIFRCRWGRMFVYTKSLHNDGNLNPRCFASCKILKPSFACRREGFFLLIASVPSLKARLCCQT